jgi:hypothetical protein
MPLDSPPASHPSLAARETLRALMNRIIPADDEPGAWAAGAGDYLERQLQGDARSLASIVAAGLASLDAESQARHARAFSELAASEQDQLLEAVERADVLTAWPVDPTEFFTRMVALTSEGYYSDPANGGNRGARSWEMIGFRRQSSE